MLKIFEKDDTQISSLACGVSSLVQVVLSAALLVQLHFKSGTRK